VDSIALPRRLRERSRFLRSASEAADRQCRTFNADAIEPLLRLIGLSPTDRVLLVGGSVGVLGAHLASTLNQPQQLIIAEPDREYLRSEVPVSLYYDAPIARIVTDSLSEPFRENSFDCIVASDFSRWFVGEELDFWLSEVNRLLTAEGDLVVLESIEEDAWRPESLHTPAGEQERGERLRDLKQELWNATNQPLSRSPRAIVEDLHERSWSVQSTGGWFQPFRLNDSHWTEQQRTDFINLRHQAGRDRLDRLRQLMGEIGFWKDEYGPLFRQLASDYQQQALRYRKALETDEETGWSGYETIVLRARAS
jgi:hypothetical protein